MHISYELRARQQTSLTPRQQQSVKLLHMSTLDCEHEIIESIENNPFLQDSAEISSFAGSGAGPTRDPDALPPPDAGMSPLPTLDPHQADDPAPFTSPEKPGENHPQPHYIGNT